ncbi:MAG: twin-arginine translocase TatA/TatE family subunit [Sulfuricurvum sp.]|uniref:Sec-independent protein translocase subunit TatA/TatB n=1 Tax=Sulfuricurvum sp. TaxID=2025608 RepID=UPI00262CBD50|nr:twin-arginine translocase TatA/TatE family subunit [Sulfuricurvum sp.]MDD5158848.1 twin-arginine translocase TatA/TatE family subunit [Sulfuricurvum sp.]
MAMPSGSELLLIFGIVVLLFGAKKIPDLAKGLGQGIRSFKKEMKDDETPPSTTATSTPVETPKQVESSTATIVEATPTDHVKQA